MTDFDRYVLFLCLTVFLMLTALLGFLIAYVTKLTVRLIRLGAEDEAIRKEFTAAKKKNRKIGCLEQVISLVICVLFLTLFAFSLYVNLREDVYFETIPTLKVVSSDSMAKKGRENTYLAKNHLDDQFARFDLLFTYKAPDENELELYDIVIYEIDDVFVIHRIVGIEEPNESHPDGRRFILQGDAVERPDKEPVAYSQIKGIYTGGKIPFAGSFIFFMQSFAGWACMLLIVFATVVTPLLEKKIDAEKKKRLASIL